MINKYPVVYFVFKRPASTIQFLDIMRNSGITKIYIFADGPRNETDKIETDKVKANIKTFKDSNKDVQIIDVYSLDNISLKQNIISGLTKVFAVEKAAIIVEDDCLPSSDFFRFCEEMLTVYANVKSVMSVNGTSAGGTFTSSYDFTKYAQCWGWATWARAWEKYDPTLLDFDPATWNQFAKSIGMTRIMTWYWRTMLSVVKSGWINTWDYQWSFAHFLNNAYAIAPSANLIKNIGFDSVATNTKTKTSAAAMPTAVLKFPLVHPKVAQENQSVTHHIERSFYANPIAILGLIRQYLYWKWSKYAHRH